MKLLIEDDQGNRSVVPVIRDEITIGRKEGNTIRLTERNVSRHHARLVQQNGRIYVEDVEARYGIKKNGQKIEDRAEFSEGDVVLIGDYRLTLRPEKAEGAQPADGDDVAAEISPELQEEQEGELDEPPDQAVESERAEVRDGDDLEGSPAEGSEPSAAQSDTQIIETDPAELVVISSNFAGQEFPLDREEMVIGRGEDCDIIIDHRSVSNTHAKIVREAPESYKIVDLNSRNGVKVSGEEYKSTHLDRGDIIELGHVKFRFVEPGEDYVFTPEDRPDDAAIEAQPGDTSIRPLVVGAGAMAVLVAVIGLYIAFGMGEQESADSTEPSAETTTASADDDSQPEPKEKTAQKSEKVEEALDEVESNIEKGKLEEAIDTLESTRKLVEPSPEQNNRIEELLSEARNEKPFRRRYDSATEALENGNPEKALENLKKIPDHSVFYEMVEKNELERKALDRSIKKAKGALEQEDYEKAEKYASLAAGYDSHKREARSLMDEIESARSEQMDEEQEQEQLARASNTNTGTAEEQSAVTKKSNGSEADERQATETEEPDPGVSAAQAKELEKSAKSKVLKGNPDGAIADCSKALRAGRSACHRVLGLAYKKKGNTAKACRHFGSYVRTSPSDESRIRGLMADLGCD